MIKNNRILPPLQPFSLLPHRRRQGRYIPTFEKSRSAYDYNNVWIRKVLDSNSDGTADSKSIFIPENYQTVVQLDDTDLSDNVDAAVTHHYLWTPGHQDKLLADTTTDGVLWSLTDHLGTIRDIVQTATSGTVIVLAHIIYDAYGNIISCKDSAGQTVENPILFAFTGKAFDTSTALQNNINRWYDPAVGRWLSPDPIGFTGNDANLYRYSKNRVLVLDDPMGLDPPPFYTDPGLQIAQKNRETQDLRREQEELRSKQQLPKEVWPEPDNYWNDDCVVLGQFRFRKSPTVLKRIKANVAEQKKVLDKMYQALDDCLCRQNATSQERQNALSKLQAIVEKAQHTPIPQSVESCGDWCRAAALENLPPYPQKDILAVDGIYFRKYFWGHAAYKITICGHYVFYLDNGWWNHISDSDHSYVPTNTQ